jgi:hypothetical protein
LRTNGFIHVSVHTYDVDELVRFYTELFEMEEIPAPNFPSPVRWSVSSASSYTSSKATPPCRRPTTSG